ncbi:hypothetical protein SAMN05428949_1979 [Chitinophaga sp. YR627]|nr:hypothetical protein SAMN05428949_1979 [Chitinophaga sp. YR627]
MDQDTNGIMASYKKEPENFQEMVDQFSAGPIVRQIGVLQLIPDNHGYNEVFEELARAALIARKKKDVAPFALYPVSTKLIKEAGDASILDEPSNSFTECAVFSEGNYVVYPGIAQSGTDILNQLLECIFIDDNKYPEQFKKKVHGAVNLLLLMSDAVASKMGHERYIQVEMGEDIEIPDRDNLAKYSMHLKFSEDSIKGLCNRYGFDPVVLQDFIVQVGDPRLKEENPEKNLVIFKPLAVFEDDYFLYMPTTVVSSLIDYIKRKAKEFGCNDELVDHHYQHQFKQASIALWHMGWVATNIVLPPDADKLPITETVLQIDNNKLGYLCFMHTAEGNAIDLTKRTQQVVEFLEQLNEDQPFEVLSLFIQAETGTNYMGSYPVLSGWHQTLSLAFNELIAISYTESTDVLTLWKFAKTYHRTNKATNIIAAGGILDAYAIYERNNGSLLDSAKKMPAGTLMFMLPGSSNNYIRHSQKKRDEHAARFFINGKPGYIKVYRHNQYAPIYKMKQIHQDHRLVIETFKMPIWVTNYQATDSKKLPWAHDLCEAVAFWLFQMRDKLAVHFNVLNYIAFEIELVVDPELIEAETFTLKETDTDQISLTLEIAPPRIKVKIPFDFMYLVRLADNRADKLLMNTVLEGIIQYVHESGKTISLTKEMAYDIVDRTLQPSYAKMVLFSDVSSNVKMDTRGLPPLRYLQETDISYVLDNLVNWLPSGYTVPEKIIDVKEKIKLCDSIVTALLAKLTENLKKFNGKQLLEWLIRDNEKAIQIREMQHIVIPAKIACFSNLKQEVETLKSKEENLVTKSHALRTLIEFVASAVPSGTKWPNMDDIDELLALTNQLTTWGALSEAMRFGITDPEMGLLPSGRIGSDKTWERQNLTSYSAAKVEADVFKYVENFASRFQSLEKSPTAKDGVDAALDEAFWEQFGISFTNLSEITGVLLKKGFNDITPCTRLREDELIALIQKEYQSLSKDTILSGINLMTMLSRTSLGTPPAGYTSQDIFPWRYSRQLSYLRRPLAKVTEDGETIYYYGYRHLDMFFDNLLYLLYTGKLPETTSEKMDTWIGSILSGKGRPFRNEVKDWFKANTIFEVIEYEVKMEPDGHINTEKDYGDIDVMVIDHEHFIIYSIECKNGAGARNIHEMKVELDLYLGRNGNDKKAKIKKHAERDVWLKAQPEAMARFVKEPSKYKIVSVIVTSDEMSITHLAGERVQLPIISFTTLRKDGVASLPK